jgi:hypothetical protein
LGPYIDPTMPRCVVRVMPGIRESCKPVWRRFQLLVGQTWNPGAEHYR